jgi:hypothetical protein
MFEIPQHVKAAVSYLVGSLQDNTLDDVLIKIERIDGTSILSAVFIKNGKKKSITALIEWK